MWSVIKTHLFLNTASTSLPPLYMFYLLWSLDLNVYICYASKMYLSKFWSQLDNQLYTNKGYAWGKLLYFLQIPANSHCLVSLEKYMLTVNFYENIHFTFFKEDCGLPKSITFNIFQTCQITLPIWPIQCSEY